MKPTLDFGETPAGEFLSKFFLCGSFDFCLLVSFFDDGNVLLSYVCSETSFDGFLDAFHRDDRLL